jgi:hypothetical protein
MIVVLPPGTKGTIHRIGFVGYCACANAANGHAKNIHAKPSAGILETSDLPLMIAPPQPPTT